MDTNRPTTRAQNTDDEVSAMTRIALDSYDCPRKVGKRWNTNKKGVLEEKDVTGHIVPLQQSLQALLSLPEVWHWVQNPHYSTDEYMNDVCDGNKDTSI